MHAGCMAVVIAPGAETFDGDPARVFLVDHGGHSSVLLPTDHAGIMVEYAYGEWSWFAVGRKGVVPMFRALCLSTDGALGRRMVPGPFDCASLRAALAFVRIYPLVVCREAADRLRRSLDDAFFDALDTLVDDPERRKQFVRSDHAYTMLNNCNPMTAHWLRELGCEVRGPAWFSIWHVRDADDAER